VKRQSKFITCFVVGKWNDYTCDKFYKKLSSRLRLPTRKRRLTLFTDGNRQNITAIKKHFPQGSVNYGIKKKIKEGDRVVSIVNKVLLGSVNLAEVAINNVDGLCSKLRERVSCFTREARGFAKKKRCIKTRFGIVSTQHNWIEKKKGKTPAMQERLHHRPITWSEILHTRLSTLN